MLRAIAIDDEPMALDVIAKFASCVPFLELTGSFTHAFEAMAQLNHRKIDLIFLDIQMPDITGMELLKALSDPPMVIFTTAHSEHAVQSFELNAVDYLLKPFSPARFRTACDKALDTYRWKLQERELKPHSFFVKSGYEIIQVAFDQVHHVESTGNYVQFILKEKTITSRLTMNEVEELLQSPAFIRIHRRFIVAKAKVTKADRKTMLVVNQLLPVGDTYVSVVEKFFL